jgi:DNA-binding MarR family transcriptional regulator
VAWRGLIDVHRRIVGDLDAQLQQATGWSLVAFDVLLQLSHAPGGRVRMYEMADCCAISRSGLTRLVARLEAAGLVVRRPGRTDPRQVFACLTPAGRVQLGEMIEVHVEGIESRFLSELTGAQTSQLAAIWRRLLSSDPSARRNLEQATRLPSST